MPLFAEKHSSVAKNFWHYEKRTSVISETRVPIKWAGRLPDQVRRGQTFRLYGTTDTQVHYTLVCAPRSSLRR